MKKLKGVITAMTTPFTADDRVDTAALEEQVDFLIQKSVHGLYPCGTTGEMFHMTAAERELVAETVVKRAAGRVTVFVHAGAMTQPETIRLARHACRIGADGVGIVTPSYFVMDERAMVTYYRTVCAALPGDFPVYVYVIPGLAGNDVPPSVMEDILGACPNVVGVKYSAADSRRVSDYLQIRGGALSVVPGTDDLFLADLSMGCDGVVSGCSGPFPEAFVAVYDAFRRGDLEEARRAQSRALELVKLMRFGADMAIFKTVLALRGLTGGHMRAPLLDLTEEQAARLKEQVAPYL